MKRQIMLVVMILFITVSMIGCNEASTESEEETNDVKDIDSEKTEETNDSNHSDDENVEAENEKEYEKESKLGYFNVSYINKDLSKKSESGPIDLGINGLIVTDIKIKDEHQDMLDGKEEGTLLVFNLGIVNTSDEQVYFFTNDAEVAADSGEVVRADKMLSELIGDPIDGGDTREGTITFLLDTDHAAINDLELTFDSTENTDNEPLGEPMHFTFSLKDD